MPLTKLALRRNDEEHPAFLDPTLFSSPLGAPQKGKFTCSYVKIYLFVSFWDVLLSAFLQLVSTVPMVSPSDRWISGLAPQATNAYLKAHLRRSRRTK